MKDINTILVAPIISEKGSSLKPLKKYVFRVAIDSNKIEIKKAVEELYKVKVDKVNVLITNPKMKRVRYNYGLTSKWKKAIVTLKEGEIDFYKA